VTSARRDLTINYVLVVLRSFSEVLRESLCVLVLRGGSLCVHCIKVLRGGSLCLHNSEGHFVYIVLR